MTHCSSSRHASLPVPLPRSACCPELHLAGGSMPAADKHASVQNQAPACLQHMMLQMRCTFRVIGSCSCASPGAGVTPATA